MIKNVKKRYATSLLLDVHGHSRKQGIFVYACVLDRRADGYWGPSPLLCRHDIGLIFVKKMEKVQANIVVNIKFYKYKK